MKMRKLMVVMVIFCLCFDTTWAQTDKSISTVYRMDVVVAANNISPQTTSMLLIEQFITINNIDGNSVRWSGWYSSGSNNRRGVIIPSGVHILSGIRYNDSMPPLILDFRPGGFYYITSTGTGTAARFQAIDLTTNVNWSPEKGQMEQLIQQHTNTTAQPGQGTRPAQGGGLQGALDRAANTVMARLQQGNTIAIISFSGENAQFAEGLLEDRLVNNGFIVVDRNELDKIRREQNFQLTGDVDDKTAVDIGKFAGAQVVITGSISGTGEFRNLRLRALNTQTATLVGSAMETF